MDPAEHAGAGLFHRAAVGLVFLEASGRIHAANARLAEWLGCAADDLHGVWLSDCVPQGQHKALMDALARAGSAEVTLELSLRAPNVEEATAVACTLALAPDPDGRLATVQRRAAGDSTTRRWSILPPSTSCSCGCAAAVTSAPPCPSSATG